MAKRLKLTSVVYGNGITSDHRPIRGMYYFSGTGPAGEVCRDCRHRVPMVTEKGQREVEDTERTYCGKAIEYYAAEDGDDRKARPFRLDMPACKYFDPRKEN